MIEHAALGVERCFWRVQILRLILPQGAASEGHYFAGLIGDRKHHAPPEAVVVALAFHVAQCQSALFQLRRFKPGI